MLLRSVMLCSNFSFQLWTEHVNGGFYDRYLLLFFWFIQRRCHMLQLVGWYWMLNWKVCGRWRTWPSSRYCPDISPEEMRKTTKWKSIWRPGWDRYLLNTRWKRDHLSHIHLCGYYRYDEHNYTLQDVKDYFVSEFEFCLRKLKLDNIIFIVSNSEGKS
jgi:hypothetical protein